MDAVALKTPMGKLHWVFGRLPPELSTADGGDMVSVPWEDDVAEVVAAYLNMHALQPLPPGNGIMTQQRRLPPWARSMQEALSTQPLLARAILVHCSQLSYAFLGLVAGALA